jgi:hypothetical protein
VAKRKGEKYQLFWREDRADFVRLAAKFDAIIVPFAAVGGDDAFDLFMVRAACCTAAKGARHAGCKTIFKAVQSTCNALACVSHGSWLGSGPDHALVMSMSTPQADVHE